MSPPIGTREADAWRAWLIARDDAAAKIAKEVIIPRMLFRSAVWWGWIDSNPLEGIRTGSQTNRATAHDHMVRDSDFERAAAKPTRGAESGALAAQNAAQQGAAESGKEQADPPQTQKGPAFMPVPAACCRSSQEGENGPGQTRTVDLTLIRGAL